MPVDTKVADRTWSRFIYARDNGHTDFVEKADLCDNYVAGNQWTETDLAVLKEAGRPAMTINKILPTILNMAGEQIANRAEISFRPRGADDDNLATVLTKVAKQVSDQNQLDYRRSEMFMDGIIRSRGFLDMRMDYSDSLTGDIRIREVNSKYVVIDPDAVGYDPDDWGDVMITSWMTADDIEVQYGKGDADILRHRDSQNYTYGYDAIDATRDRFGMQDLPLFANGGYGSDEDDSQLRDIRVIDHQHRELDRQQFFVERATGEMRPVPEDFTDEQIKTFTQTYGFALTKRLVRRIRWTVVADDVVLHDEWSPYSHFTIIPYFPLLRHGRTLGYVENLVGPQDILNKVSSQELHVVNTTANSGYIVEAGNLVNMSMEELEQKGSQSGLAIEVNKIDGIQKITPNQVPQGLDRVSSKAEASIDTISGVNDSMKGFDREDVAAKAIETKKKSGVTGLAKCFDNLTRSDYILARNMLDLIQEFYTDERIITITKDSATGETESFGVNQQDPTTGQIKNDLTLGEFDVIITSVPHRETLEDSEFEQLVALREMGVQIPDTTLVGASRVRNKSEIIEQLQAGQNSPEAQQAKQLALRGQEAEVGKTEAEKTQKEADAQLKMAKAGKEGVAAQKEAATPIEQEQGADPVDQAATAAAAQREDALAQHKMQMGEVEARRKQEKDDTDAQLKAQDMEQKRRAEVVRQAREAAAAAQKPTPNPQST